MNSTEIEYFLNLFGQQSLIVPLKERNKSATEFPLKPKTLKPENVEKTFGPLNSEGDYGLFFLVNESNHPTKRKLENITRCRAIWIEDDKTGEVRDDFPIAPNIVVNSSPGKYHYYWLTSTDNVEEHQRVMQTLVDEWNCDPNARDAARVLRIPGTYHNKTSERFLVSAEYKRDQEYSWKEILKAFPPTQKIVKINHDETGKFDKTAAESKIESSENYHETLRDLAMSYANKNIEREDIADLLRMKMLKVPSNQRDERWQARIEDQHIYECVDSALRKINDEQKTQIEILDDSEIQKEYVYKSEKLDIDILAPPNTRFGELVNIYRNSAFEKNYMSAFLAATATVAYLAGGKYMIDDKIKAGGLQQLGLGMSGVGKDVIVNGIQDIIHAVFYADPPNDQIYKLLSKHVVKRPASVEGLEDLLLDSDMPDLLLTIDEAGEFIGQGLNGYGQKGEILNYLLEMFSSGRQMAGRSLRKNRGNNKDNGPKHTVMFNPTVGFVGASTIYKFNEHMGSKFVDHGNAPRLCLHNCDLYIEEMTYTDDNYMVPITDDVVSEDLSNALQKIADQSKLTGSSKTSIPLPMARASNYVKVAYADYSMDEKMFNFHVRLKDQNRMKRTGPIWNRAAWNVKLYAMLFAIIEEPFEPVIHEWMLENAIKIVLSSLNFADKIYDAENMANSEEGKLRVVIEKLLKDAYPKAMTKTQMYRASTIVHNSRTAIRNAVLRDLVEENVIDEFKRVAPGAKKPSIYYIWQEK